MVHRRASHIFFLLALLAAVQGGLQGAAKLRTTQPLLRLRGGLGDLTNFELDELFTRATRTRPEFCDEAGRTRTILPTWSGSSVWLWGQFPGTVLEAAWKKVLFIMMVSVAIIIYARLSALPSSWPFWAAPDASQPFIQKLKLCHAMWSYLLTISTFVTTFMIGHA